MQFRQVDTFGLPSQFGGINGVTLKFVPIRDEADFENYPIHQPGFKVADLQKVVDLAIKHGGKMEGQISQKDGKKIGAIRDPDGNTLELYEE